MNEILPNIPNYIQEKLDLKDGRNTYSVHVDGIYFPFYAHIKESNRKALFILPGDISPTKPRPNFQRFSWSESINANVFSIPDIATLDDDAPTLCWCQGKDGQNYYELLSILVQEIIKNLKIDEKDIIFFGSSAGGFGSLKMAEFFPKATIWAINPQIYLYKFHGDQFNTMLNYAYNNLSKEEVLDKYKDRFEINIDYSQRKNPVIIWQNIQDRHHYNQHLLPYLENKEYQTLDNFNYLEFDFSYLKESKYLNIKLDMLQNKPNIHLYDNIDAKHNPPLRWPTCVFLNKLISI